jgi:glycine/D-amino acid oxidase-like deaminating enzyme
MRPCEIAIIGLGLMGSSALHSLVRRGADVLGFDPITVGEARGSSRRSVRGAGWEGRSLPVYPDKRTISQPVRTSH